MPDQVVRRMFPLNEAGTWPKGAVKITSSADFLLHTVAANRSGTDAGSVVVEGVLADGGIESNTYFRLPKPEMGSTGPVYGDVYLGCIGANATESLRVRGTLDNVKGHLWVVLTVITAPGATVNMDAIS